MRANQFPYGTKVTAQPYSDHHPRYLLSENCFVKKDGCWLDVENERDVTPEFVYACAPEIFECDHDFIDLGCEFFTAGYGHDDDIRKVCRHCGLRLDHMPELTAGELFSYPQNTPRLPVLSATGG